MRLIFETALAVKVLNIPRGVYLNIIARVISYSIIGIVRYYISFKIF